MRWLKKVDTSNRPTKTAVSPNSNVLCRKSQKSESWQSIIWRIIRDLGHIHHEIQIGLTNIATDTIWLCIKASARLNFTTKRRWLCQVPSSTHSPQTLATHPARIQLLHSTFQGRFVGKNHAIMLPLAWVWPKAQLCLMQQWLRTKAPKTIWPAQEASQMAHPLNTNPPHRQSTSKLSKTSLASGNLSSLSPPMISRRCKARVLINCK